MKIKLRLEVSHFEDHELAERLKLAAYTQEPINPIVGMTVDLKVTHLAENNHGGTVIAVLEN